MISYIKYDDFSILENENNLFGLYSEYIKFHHNIKKNIIIVPGFLKTLINDNRIIEVEDIKFKVKKIPENINFKSDKKLKERQEKAFNILSEIYNQKGYINGIIKARCRFGKTILASYIISHFKQKTIIIVDSKALLNQWIGDMVNFLDIDPSMIGRINDKYEELDKPIVVAMVQSINSKIKNDITGYYSKIHAAGFGFVFVDEAHSTTSAKEYSKATMLFNTQNIIGLTATPNQNDVNKFLVDATIGPIIFEYKEYELIPEIYFKHFKSELKTTYTKMIRLRNARMYIESLAVYQSDVQTNQKYIKIIIELVILILSEKNRRLMIIVPTCNDPLSIGQILNRILFKLNVKTTLLFGKNNIIGDDTDVILATYKKGHRGLTINNLTDLIFAVNFSGNTPLIQSSGRLLGIVDGFDKPTPRVFHLIDDSIGNIFTNSIQTKKAVYLEEYGDNIEFYDI